MDLRNLVPNESFVKKLTNPITGEILVCGDETEMFIELFHIDSKTYRGRSADLARKEGSKKNQKKSPEQNVRQLMEQYALTIKDWNIELDGEKVELTTEKAIEILYLLPWIKDVIVSELGDLSNFLPSQSDN